MTSESKRLTHLTVCVGVAIFLVALYVSRETFLERYWLWKLEAEDDDQRKTAAERLGAMGSVRAIPILVQLLRDYPQPEATVEGKRIILFTSVPKQSPLSNVVIFEMRDDYWQSFWIGKAIAAIGSRGIPLIAEGIKDDGWLWTVKLDGPSSRGGIPVRRNLIMDIGLRKAIDEIGPAAFPHLVDMSKDENPNTRRLAVLSLPSIGQDPDEVIEVLLGTLKDEDHRIRFLSAWAIGEFGSVAVQAIPALEKALDDDHERVRAAARELLAKIAGSPK